MFLTHGTMDCLKFGLDAFLTRRQVSYFDPSPEVISLWTSTDMGYNNQCYYKTRDYDHWLNG